MIRIPLRLFEDEFINHGIQLCSDGLHEWFDFPETVTEIDLVISPEFDERGYRCVAFPAGKVFAYTSDQRPCDIFYMNTSRILSKMLDAGMDYYFWIEY